MAPPPRSTGRTSGLVSTPSWTAGWSSARRSRSRSKANSSSSRKRPRRPAADIADPLLLRRMPNLNCELAGPAGLRGGAGRLANNKALYRHGMLGELNPVDPKPHPACDLQAHGIEQSPDVGHDDPPRRAWMRRQPICEGHQATKQFRLLGANGQIEALRPPPRLRGKAPLRDQPSAAAPDAGRRVIAGPGYRI